MMAIVIHIKSTNYFSDSINKIITMIIIRRCKLLRFIQTALPIVMMLFSPKNEECGINYLKGTNV